MRNKILITGSNGLLGLSLRNFFLNRNFVIVATGRGPDKFLNSPHLYLNLDIESTEESEMILAEYKPDIIINTAALTNVDYCETNQSKCLSVNSHSILNFTSYCRDYNPHFIHISTDFVFDGKQGDYREDDICNPINYYGFSKLESEKIISQNKFRSTIIRTSLVYSLNDDINNFASRCKINLGKNEPLNIVDDQYRTPTFVDDLSRAIFSVIEKEKYGIYHISSGEVLSIYQIVCNIARYWGFDSSLIQRVRSNQLQQQASRPLNSSLSIDKSILELDFKPTILSKVLK